MQPKSLTYHDQPWHKDCFLCTGCKQQLSGQRFTSRDDFAYCLNCFCNLYAKKCASCTSPISGTHTHMHTHDRHWHEECFHCFQCKRSLVDKPFSTKDEQMLCTECYSNEYSSKCHECKKTIMPGLGGSKYISFEERQWHNDCFNCKKCSVSLVGRGFLTERDDILCPECGKDI
uniref:Four and a half LIM domains 2a n=1 Tax=Astyanax mexicanus TaxID=7994 RepID=A0A8B9LNW8_ASTMX